jgi:integrase
MCTVSNKRMVDFLEASMGIAQVQAHPTQVMQFLETTFKDDSDVATHLFYVNAVLSLQSTTQLDPDTLSQWHQLKVAKQKATNDWLTQLSPQEADSKEHTECLRMLSARLGVNIIQLVENHNNKVQAHLGQIVDETLSEHWTYAQAIMGLFDTVPNLLELRPAAFSSWNKYRDDIVDMARIKAEKLTVDNIWIHAKDLKPFTVKRYMTDLRTLCDGMKKSVHYIIAHPDEAAKYINTNYPNEGTAKNFFTALKSIYRHHPELKGAFAIEYDKLDSHFDASIKKYKAKTTGPERITERQTKSFVPWTEVMAKQQELAQTEYGSTRHLLLAMYTLTEPRRQDYGSMKIMKTMPADPTSLKFNFIVLTREKATLVMNAFKTDAAYKQKEERMFVLSPELTALIRHSLNSKPRDYLFVNTKDNPYSDATYTVFSNNTLKEIFGREGANVSMLRHAYITHFQGRNPTFEEKVKISQAMGHSVGMQAQYAYPFGQRCRVVCE